MAHSHRNLALRHLLCALFLCLPGAALAGIHTWDVNEVYTNADGSIQFIELWEAGGGGSEIYVGNGSLTSNTQSSFAFGQGPVEPPTSHRFYLIATEGFAALPGAPTPDVIIPAEKVPFFDSVGDTVTFYSVDSWAFGAVPTNGVDSLDRHTGVGPNTPTNYAGETGTIDASSSSSVPTLSAPALWMLVALMLAAGVAAPHYRGPSNA